MKPRFAYLAVIGMFAAALTLAGCGRKGPLDPPPSENAPVSTKRAASTPSLNPLATGEKKKKTTPAAFDADGKPIANPNAPKKRLPIDWLLD